MIYTALTRKAMLIAYEAHQGQLDAAGVPYVFHPFHVAEQMTEEYAVCVALLHDVLEDSGVTAAELERDFPPEITEAVRCLTHSPEEDYFDYVRRVRENPLAKTVKLADLRHNMDESRLSGEVYVPRERLLRWRKKYSRALEILNSQE